MIDMCVIFDHDALLILPLDGRKLQPDASLRVTRSHSKGNAGQNETIVSNLPMQGQKKVEKS